jgi:hypothetical protein
MTPSDHDSRLLEALLQHVHLLPQAQLLHAKALFAAGSCDAAQRKAADVLRGTPSDVGPQLLVCSIYVQQVGLGPRV